MNLARSRGIAPALVGVGVWIAVAGCSPATSSLSASASASTASASTASASAASTAGATSAAPSSASIASSTPANAVPVVVAADGRPFVMWDCESKPLVEPAGVVLACGDGTYGLQGVHWTKWAPANAVGAGTEYLNDCTPDCATGHYHDYPVDVTLTGSDLVAQNEPFAYTKLVFAFTANRPPVTALVNGKHVVTHPATFSVQLWTGRPAGAKYPAGAPHAS